MPEVVFEPVSDEDGACVDEEAHLLVGGLQRGQVLRAEVGVQISRFDACRHLSTLRESDICF